MKKTFVFISIAAMLLAACSGNQHKENMQDEKHTHDDGSVHQNHESTDTVVQEEFAMPADTAHHNADGGTHSHNGNEHQHQH